MKKGLRFGGILAMALAIASCGDSDVRVSTGPGFVPSPGTFSGDLSDGGDITIEVGSIESITFDCDDEVITERFTPPQEIENDGTFVLKFADGGRQFRIEGQFRDDNTVDGVINDENNECDVSFDAFRGDRGTPTPVRTSTPNNGVTATQTPGGTLTATVVPTGPTPTGGPDDPTPTPTSSGGDACPVAVEVEGNAGTGEVLDSGWTGLAHNATVVSEGKLTFTVSGCDSPVRPCGVCDVGGPIPNLAADDGDINSQRCSNDPSITCTTGGSECTGGSCIFYFGAPLPLSAGGIGTCVLNQVTGNVSGTANVETGAFASTINLTSRVHTGQVDQPCPRCEGSDTPNDGTKAGTCNGGGKNGQPCDVNGVSPIQAFGSTSLDCPPSGFISALTIPLVGSSGTETRTLSASSPNCTGAPGKKCFCGGSGEPPKPNSCLDNTSDSSIDGSLCTQQGGQNEGICPEIPAESYCLPSEPYRGCLLESDCPVESDTCQAVTRPCYLDNGVVGGSVSAIGMADPPENGISNPTFASLFCIPATGQSAVNIAGGLPGLGRIELPLVSKEILTLPAQ